MVHMDSVGTARFIAIKTAMRENIIYDPDAFAGSSSQELLTVFRRY